MVGINYGDGIDGNATPAIVPNATSGISTPDTPVLSETTHQTFSNALTYGLPGIALGAVDTLGQSLHILKNDSIPKALANFTGTDPGGFGDFYTRNQAEMRATGEIAGMLLPGLAGMKALKSVQGLREAGSIGSWAKNSTALDVLLGNSAEMAAANTAIKVETETAVYNQGIFAGRTVNSPAMRAAKLNLYGKKASDAVRTTAAFEIGNFAAFNSSQLFYPSDTTVWDQAKWAGAGAAVGVGLELAATRYAMRQMIKATTNRMSTGAAGEVFNLSPTQKYADQIMFRPGERGVGLTAYAGMNADLEEFAKSADQTASFRTSVYQDQINIKAVQTKQIDLMAHDPHEYIPRATLTPEQRDLTLSNLKANPTTLLNATKLGNLPEEGMTEFYANITKGMDKAKKDLETSTILAGLEKDPVKKGEILSTGAKAFNPVYDASTEVHYVMEPTGGFTLYKDRADNWLDTNNFAQIKGTPYTTKAPDLETPIKNLKLTADADHKITVHDNFRIETVNNATPLDHSAMYAVGSKMLQKWKPVEGQQFILTPEVNWRTLEMTSALAKQKPEAAQQVILNGSKEQQKLIVARKLPDGTIKYGTPNQYHSDLFSTEELSGNLSHDELRSSMGFAEGPNQPFMSRTEAANFVKTNQPNVNVNVRPTRRTPDGRLEMADYKDSLEGAGNKGFSSMDDVDFHVLNEKVKGVLKDMDIAARPEIASKGSLLGRLQGPKLTPAQIIAKYNLPIASGLEQNPVLEMVAHMKLQGMDDLNDMFPKPNGGRAFDQPYTQLDLVKKHLQETAGVDTAVPFQGKLLEQTSDTKPVFVAAKALPELSIADANLQARVMVMRDVHLEKLSGIKVNDSPLVAGVMGKIFDASNPGGNLGGTANTARLVQTLQDGVLSGTGQIVYQDRINSQFPALKALQSLAQDNDKFISNYVDQLAQANLTPKFAAVLNPKNKSDLLDFNRVEQSYRHGWDISGIVPAENGKGFSFVLDPDSKTNQRLKELHFPGEEEIPEHMPDMSVTAKKQGMQPLVVSKNASDLAAAISDMSRQSGVENNTLRTALGKNPITIRDFHLPTPALNKEGSWFVYNPQGDVIATYTGPSLRENQERAQKTADTLGQGHTAVPLETVKFDRQQNDDTFFNLVNYSDQLNKTGAGIKGGLAHTEIDTGDVTLKAMVRSLQEQYLHVGIRARAAIFEPELNYARQAADSATALTRDNTGGFNIFDRYIATMFSQAPRGVKSGANSSIITNTYRGIESSYDRTLTWMYSHFSELSAANESGKVGAGVLKSLLKTRSSENEFKQFQKTLPSWSPFQETADWAESTFKEKGKLSARALTGELSKLSSTMSLRFLDVGTAINNFAGLATNMHSVVYGLRRLGSESESEWLARTSAYGSQYVDGVMTFDPNKALNTAIKSYWRGELAKPMEDAAKQGYFTPEYAALAKALTVPQSPGQEALGKFTHYANALADNSEAISRKMAWGMGYKIGKDLHQFKNENDAYIFANNFVNDMIGNYSPNNKPAMFQGAVGTVLGTFQTYMFNFYRRLYENIETGNKAALMAQYAAQSSVFGARSVPGYAAWNSLFQSHQDTGDDFTGRLRQTFPPGVGDLLLNGSLSNIPKIFTGLQGDGFALYSRGSVDMVQAPATLLDISRAPPIQFLSETYNGITATLKNVMSGFSMQQQEEILANFSTNRAMKSLMELAADAKTSKKGDVIDKGTRDIIHVLAATMGTQTLYARSQQEAYSKNQSVSLAQADLRETLNVHTKSLLRSGDFTTDDLRSVVQQYINARGNPAYLGQWFRNELMMATEPRTQKQLQSLANSGKMDEFQDMLATLQQNQDPNIAKGNQ